jgi:hypothetical protein
MGMDLVKLDPMARKMRSHVDAFYDALSKQDGITARTHIHEIMKYADYINKDIETTVMKSEMTPSAGINDIYAGGVPVQKVNEVQSVHTTTSNILPGTIRTNRFGTLNRRLNNRTL